MTERMEGVFGVVLALSLILCGFAAGGLVILTAIDAGRTSPPSHSEFPAAGVVLAVAMPLSVITGVVLHRRKSRRGAARGLAVAGGLALAFCAGELLSRQVVPAWPARALHGVPPAKWAAAMGAESRGEAGDGGLNSWGQRDRERTLRPPAGVRRIAFIGDSFLEEGGAVPVALQAERAIGRDDVEVLNLGVSATGPDEYYDRLRSVALPLGMERCCLFIFSGNDFVSPERTLTSYAGVAAVEPRPSLLTTLGCAGWNHLLTNNRRPVIEAWLAGGMLARDEQARSGMLRQARDDQIRQMLLQASGFEGAALRRLAARLDGDDMPLVFRMLREPDDGRFRSYYLTDALRAAAQEGWQWEPNSDDVAWQWTQRAARLCLNRKVPLTVVVIPEGFQVDDRMREQWLPLADMRRCTAPCRAAAATFVRRARAESLDVIDLHEVLQGTRGTYLNLDGHWSEAGIALVAGLLAQHMTAGDSPSGAVAHERQ